MNMIIGKAGAKYVGDSQVMNALTTKRPKTGWVAAEDMFSYNVR